MTQFTASTASAASTPGMVYVKEKFLAPAVPSGFVILKGRQGSVQSLSLSNRQQNTLKKQIVNFQFG